MTALRTALRWTPIILGAFVGVAYVVLSIAAGGAR